MGEVLVAVLAQDPFAIKKLNQQLRVLTVLSAFETQKMLTLSMQTQIAELEPGDAIKGFNKLTEVIGQLTDDKTSTNLNINEHVYRQLPPDIRRAISIVQQQPQLKAVNDDNEEEIDVVDQYIKDNAA